MGAAPTPVLLPIIEFAARLAILAKVTDAAAMVVANEPTPVPVTSPVSVIVWSPVFAPDIPAPTELIERELPSAPAKVRLLLTVRTLPSAIEIPTSIADQLAAVVPVTRVQVTTALVLGPTIRRRLPPLLLIVTRPVLVFLI